MGGGLMVREETEPQVDAVKELKKCLRQKMLERRRNLSSEARMAASAAIAQRSLALPRFQAARSVFAYASMPEEVQLDGLLEAALAQGKRVAIPQITGKGTMEAVLLPSLPVLERGAYGIRVVPEKLREIVPPEELDLAIVPGAAFREDGARLGLGGGFYDRYLGTRATSAYRLALALDCQMTEEAIPMAAHDIWVDAIITENREIAIKP